MTSTYEVKLRVALNMLPTLLQVIERTRGVELVNVSAPAEIAESSANKPLPTFRTYVGGVRNKGITGVDLVMETLAASGGRCVRAHIEKKFRERGFAEQSTSSTLSRLMREGKIRRPTADSIESTS